MMILNPLQIKLAAIGALVVAVLLASLTAWALLERSGRLGCKVDLVRAQDQVQVLADKLDTQTAAINDLGAITSRGRKELRDVVAAIGAQHTQTRLTVAGLEDSIKARTPAAADGRPFDCRDAIRIWREQSKVDATGARK